MDFSRLLDDPGARLGLSLLAAASPTVRNAGFGERLAQGVGMFDQWQGNKSAEEERKRRMALQEQMAQIQLQALLQQQQREKEAAQRQAGIESAYRSAFRSPQQQALSGGGGPTPANAAKIPGLQPKLDQQALIQGLMSVDPVMAAQLATPKPKKIKSVEQWRDKSGQVVNVALYEDGSTEVMPFGVKPDISLMSLGDRTQAVDKTQLRGGESWREGLSPAGGVAAEANAIARQQLFQTRDLANQDMALRIQERQIKMDDAAKAKEKSVQAALTNAENVRGALSEAMSLVGQATAGFGSMLSAVPQSSARDLRAKLETVKARLGFDELERMREASPTGGALGQVAVQELVSLQSTVASLDQAQSPEQLAAALQKVDRHYANWENAVRESSGLPPKSGASGSWQPPSQDAVEAEMRRRGLTK